MKKSKKSLIGIVLLVIGIIGIIGFLGAFSEIDNKGMLGSGSAVLIVAGVVLLILDDEKRPEVTSDVSADTSAADPVPVADPTPGAAPAAKEKRSVPDGQMNYNILSDVVEGSVLCYEYEQSMFLTDDAFDYIPGNGGKPLTFVQEPENIYDNKAVAIYLKSAKIGYIYRGITQDMVNDYIKRGWLILGHLNKFSTEDKKATYKIGFYKPLDIMESETFPLAKVKKRIDEYTTRIDNLEQCEEGEDLRVVYSEIEDSYIVYGDVLLEIGELPESAIDFISENKHKKIVTILDKIKENDNGIYGARITIYLVK